MKKHPLSLICAYVMLGALVIFGLAGVAIEYVDLLPPEWRPVTEYAQTAIVGSLAGAFVAAALASMLSAAHAERAHQAGKGHSLIMWMALGYAAVCIVIEVSIGKLGARMIGAEVNTLALTLLLTFFAVAPRAVAWILAGLEGIEREQAEAAEDKEHRQTLDRIRVVNETTTARIDKGVADLEAERKSRGSLGRGAATIGAAAALLGATAVDVPEATANVPIPFEERPQLHVEPSEGEDIRLNIPGDNWKRGPRQANRNTFVEVLNKVRENPESSVSGLSREFGIDRKTAKIWRNWALSIIDHPSNALLSDAA